MAGLKDMMPQVSRVTKTTDNLICTIYGRGGLGKTPVACKMEKPIYFAFGKAGLSGLNNVPFYSIKTWADFKQKVKFFTDPANYEELHQDVQTIILDEMEVLYTYAEKYVANSEGCNKIKEGNGGYGLWGDLKAEWEAEMMKLIGSGFCIMFILHTQEDERGYNTPVGDPKRMLPILLNHSEIIGYVKSNGVDEDGRPIHSSLVLTHTDECFARTRNEYFEPIIPDFTAENLVNAYYDAIDRQSKAEGVAPISKAEQDSMYETTKRSFEEVMDEIAEVGGMVRDKLGTEALTEVVEQVLGKGAQVSKCTPKQQEAVEVILMQLKELLKS